MCPAVDGLGLNKNARDYSPYIPLEIYKQPITKWIYGISQTAFTGYCKHNNTFLACNSKDAKGYYEGMVTHLDP
jgi:hypothetical protein